MHQPDYRDSVSGEYVLPWTYLHALKDYTDMAWHLETNPDARVTFNFVPVLLDQLEDYADQFKKNKMRDPLLALLAEKDLNNLSQAQCELIIQSCFKSHHEKMLTPFIHYQRLYNIFRTLESESEAPFNYLSAQYKADLLVWYHLAWTGESIRRENELIKRLMSKGYQFTWDDRLAFFRLIGDLIGGLIDRYRQLLANGQIEVSTTPYYHPILPLLIDFRKTRDAMPYAPLPAHHQYPGGRDRAVFHIRQALNSHGKRFSEKPVGMWPAEGGVSHEALSLMAKHGVRWAATGEGVLANSLYKSYQASELPPREDYLYKPYRVTSGEHAIVCFFRDDLLSDKIGFEYSKLHSNDAVRDFIGTLEHIHRTTPDGQNRVVSVVLDGENAWEYYPYNGYYFLSELYAALAEHPDIEMTTFSDILQMCMEGQVELEDLPALASGSWVYGSFSTWIGSHDKNLAWDLLCEAKTVYDKVVASGKLNEYELPVCERQLAICEGSDWFWWFGDYNSTTSVVSFDRLYRRNLANLYRLLKQPVPAVLDKPISAGSHGLDAGGAMRRGQDA